MVRRMAAPPTMPPEVNTGLVVPVISALTVRVLAPLWRKNSEAEEAMRPRTAAEPMVRAALSEPERRPPAANVSVSDPAAKFTVAAAPLRVSVLIVWPPAVTVWVPLKRTLLVPEASASVGTSSGRASGRKPTAGS